MKLPSTRRLLNKLHSRIRRGPRQILNVGWDCGLPEDILELIFHSLLELGNDPQNSDLVQLSLYNADRTCWTWHEIGTKYLYRVIHLSSTSALRKLVTALDENEQLRPLVHQFCFNFPAFVSHNADFYDTEDSFPDEKKIYELCPNLSYKQIPWSSSLETTEGDFGVAHLTHLELFGPKSMFSERWAIPPTSVELPVLQSLSVGFTTFIHTKGRFQWFRMPQLRRLSVTSLDLMGTHPFELPKHSPLIDTIELLSCSYSIFYDFFNPYESPLLPYAKTLTRLTIIGTYFGRIDNWSLGFLEGLKVLCLPFIFFANMNIKNYPPNLVDLAVIGSIRNSFKEDIIDLWKGCYALERALNPRKEKLRKLKRLHVRAQDAEYALFIDDPKKELHLELGVRKTVCIEFLSVRGLLDELRSFLTEELCTLKALATGRTRRLKE
ncbi:hypothetical protein ACEPAG_4268 [Sanghuangporus baumii]